MNILLIHGWNYKNYYNQANDVAWSNRIDFINKLKEKHAVYYPDLPGFGKNKSPNDKKWSLDDYSKYILTWIVHNVSDLKPNDVDFVFNTEAKSSDSNALFNQIKGLKIHHSIIKIGTSRPIYLHDKAFWELYKEIEANDNER